MRRGDSSIGRLGAIAALAAFLVFAGHAAHAEVGIAAAVNQNAKGRPPGGSARVIALGQQLVFDEQVSTDPNGQVQVLLLDGTTFTIGPNSDLKIDEFVFNPDSGQAKVVATVTKGAFRFIGAKTTQTEGGATINAPVGTIGVRGGSVVCAESGGQQVCMMPFGKEVTITDKSGQTHTIFKPGWLVAFDGNGNYVETRKATVKELGAITTAMTTRGSGGAAKPPSNQAVEQSGVAQTNSQLPNVVPENVHSEAVKSNPLSDASEQTANDAAQNTVNENIVPQTLLARVLTSPSVFIHQDGQQFPLAGDRGLVGSTPDSDQDIAFFHENGRLVSVGRGIDLPDLSGTQGDTPFTPAQAVSVSGTSPLGNVSGTAYAGRGDFVAYMLGVNGDPTQPFYVIYGTPSTDAQIDNIRNGSDVREYVLTEDPIQQSPAPFFNEDLYGPVTNYSSTNFYIVEPANSDGPARGFQSFVSIEGSGPNQRSAVQVVTPVFYTDENGVYQGDGARRGSFRYNSTEGPVILRGGLGTVGGGSGDHFYGANADHFVIGQGLDPADTYFDGALGGPFTDNPNDGYIGDGNSGTHHVASLVSETPQSALSRDSQQLRGFASGLGESDVEGSANPYALTGDQSGSGGPNFSISLDATQNTVFAQADLHDSQDQNPVVSGMLLSFGGVDADSTFVNNDTYGTYTNTDPENTRLRTDGGGDIASTEEFSPGSYLVSGRANPIAGYQHCQQCTFIQWGWWGTRILTPENPGEGVNDERGDFVHMGTWVAGDISSYNEVYGGPLPFGGSATYAGTALGNVARDMGDGTTAKYIASGDFDMDFDFNTRTGNASITNFDGMNLYGTLSDTSTPQDALFGGSLSGDNPYTVGDPYDTVDGRLDGAFVNDGPNVAAGVIGNFNVSGTGYTAVGTVAAVETSYSP